MTHPRIEERPFEELLEEARREREEFGGFDWSGAMECGARLALAHAVLEGEAARLAHPEAPDLPATLTEAYNRGRSDGLNAALSSMTIDPSKYREAVHHVEDAGEYAALASSPGSTREEERP